MGLARFLVANLAGRGLDLGRSHVDARLLNGNTDGHPEPQLVTEPMCETEDQLSLIDGWLTRQLRMMLRIHSTNFRTARLTRVTFLNNREVF